VDIPVHRPLRALRCSAQSRGRYVKSNINSQIKNRFAVDADVLPLSAPSIAARVGKPDVGEKRRGEPLRALAMTQCHRQQRANAPAGAGRNDGVRFFWLHFLGAFQEK